VTSDAHLKELGNFFKARRSELSSTIVGLPASNGQRKVPGLRREEVAGLADISIDYYKRLEQGRIQPSTSVLTALARVMNLSDDELDYVLELAGRELDVPRPAVQIVQPQLSRMLDDLSSTPGMILGRRMDILAWNPMAAALICDFAKLPPPHRNYARVLFTDPSMKALYPQWEAVALNCIATLRRQSATHPDDPQLAALVDELSACDDFFRRWWAAHRVAPRGGGTKVLCHPVVGELILDWDTLVCSIDPDQQLVIWTAEAGTSTHDALTVLSARTQVVRTYSARQTVNGHR
jgi:transcriptional regulator with XRE-family HTH domain